MKELYRKFGQILFIDGTYKLNRNNYPVYVIAVQDNHGNSQIIAIAITAYERIVSIRSIFDRFVSTNDISITKTIMIDKDLKEFAVLRVSFELADSKKFIVTWLFILILI